MNHPVNSRRTLISRTQAIALLYPIAAFFKSGGMNEQQALAALAAATKSIRRSEGRRDLEHIGTFTCYQDLIATWTREPRFLNSRGQPRLLKLSGVDGFAALVKSTGTRRDPTTLLNVLLRYRNVRRLSDGRVQLVSPIFRVSAGSRLAFEPSTIFLNDATSTLTYTLKNATSPKGPDLFWRNVHSLQVSKADARKFMQFAKERSLLFLEEMDDWLQAHASSRRRVSKRKLRIGLGLFSIYSDGAQLSPLR